MPALKKTSKKAGKAPAPKKKKKEEPPEYPVEVGDRFKVQREEKWFLADVVDKRLLRASRKALEAEEVEPSQIGPVDYEYYVHFDDTDTRLDEWVDIDRIDSRFR